jgi:hypothetical protein
MLRMDDGAQFSAERYLISRLVEVHTAYEQWEEWNARSEDRSIFRQVHSSAAVNQSAATGQKSRVLHL